MKINRKSARMGMTHYLKRFWAANFLAILPTLAVCALQTGTSLVMIQTFQSIIERDLRGFAFWIAVMMGAWFLLLGINSLQDFFQGRAVRAMNNAVRRDMAATLLGKNHGEFHALDTGEYLSWFTNDVNQIENLAWSPFYQCVDSAATVVFSAAALLTLHWSLLGAALATTVVMLLVPRLFNKRMEALGGDCAREQAAATSRLKDLLAGYDVLRSFGREQRFRQGADAASDQIEGPKFRLTYVKGFVGAGIGCVNILCQMLVNVLIGILSIRGVILQGSLMGGGNLCGSLSNALGSMAQLLLSFSSSRPYFEKITGDGRTGTGGGLERLSSAVTVENLSFQYGGRPILRDLSLQFKRGGKYALTGPSGCGKSTLLKLLLGWLPDYGGAIRFDGRDAKSFTPEQLQRQMSYIEQNVFLFNSTIRDNITLGGSFTDAQLEQALRDSALAGDLASMPDGLDTLAGEEGGNLSGGQKQRVAIARALIHDRSILLVDEGTSALDQKNADIVEKSLLANRQLTLILVSHHLSPERKAQFTQVYELQPA
jgi:ATP-binding cassette subfamily B protein